VTHSCTVKGSTLLPSIQRGFTLIEMLIVVALIGILASVAYPSYTDHVARGYIADATSALSRTRVAMEQFYQDRRNYGAGGCGPAMPANVKNFTVTCALGGGANPDQSFLMTATGTGSMTGYTYTVDHTNAQRTTSFAGTSGTWTCWRMRKADSC
jgi:type IV pilus assembly protein PilE